MIQDAMTLADVLNDPRIRPVAADAIRDMDLSQEEWWQWTFQQIEEAHFGGSLKAGFTRLFEAAESGNWYYPLRENGETHLVWFPSKDEKAGERPFILVVPGGGFTNVWNLTEGWPIGNRFNEQGYHVFILTYRVQSQEHLLDREMEDFALALSFIKEHAARFGVQADLWILRRRVSGQSLECARKRLYKVWPAETRSGLPGLSLDQLEAVPAGQRI